MARPKRMLILRFSAKNCISMQKIVFSMAQCGLNAALNLSADRSHLVQSIESGSQLVELGYTKECYGIGLYAYCLY